VYTTHDELNFSDTAKENPKRKKIDVRKFSPSFFFFHFLRVLCYMKEIFVSFVFIYSFSKKKKICHQNHRQEKTFYIFGKKSKQKIQNQKTQIFFFFVTKREKKKHNHEKLKKKKSSVPF
jgi:hypothetical protein